MTPIPARYPRTPIPAKKILNRSDPDTRLNGLGLRDGRVRYVTALGETNTPGGWRANEKDGGVLIDLEANEVTGLWRKIYLGFTLQTARKHEE